MGSLPDDLRLIRVEPQPEYIQSSGRWKWPLSREHDNGGRCPFVVTASREWWEYAPSGAKPHPFAEGVCLRDDVWYWAVPDNGPTRARAETAEKVLQAVEKWRADYEPSCPEDVYQRDRCSVNATELVEEVMNVAGYHVHE